MEAWGEVEAKVEVERGVSEVGGWRLEGWESALEVGGWMLEAGVGSDQVNRSRKDRLSCFEPIFVKSHISRIRSPRLAMKSTQPSKR